MEQRLTKPKSTRMNVIEQFDPIVSEASDKQHSEETIDNVEIDVMRTEETGKVCRDHWEKGGEREWKRAWMVRTSHRVPSTRGIGREAAKWTE